MGALTKLIIVLAIGFFLAYEGFLGSQAKQIAINIVQKVQSSNLGSHSSSSMGETNIIFVAPNPNEPIKIETKYNGVVAVPIDVKMKIAPSDVVTISFNKIVTGKNTWWRTKSVSHFELWVSGQTLQEAKKYGIQITYIPFSNTEVGFKISAPPQYPDNKTPTIEFMGAIAFYINGYDLKQELSAIFGGSGTKTYHLAVVFRSAMSNREVDIPVFVVDNGGHANIQEFKDNSEIGIWMSQQKMKMLIPYNNNEW